VPGLYVGSALKLGLQLIRTKNMLLAMDGNNNVEMSLDDPLVAGVLRRLDVFLPNRAEALRLTGEPDMERALERLGAHCPLVVVKDGANGAIAMQNGLVYRAPAIPVIPLDTTGAGDAFDAGFLKAWLDGRSIAECLRWGAIVGGLSTLGAGGTGKVTRVKDVESWLAKI
jgi:ribokinase